MVDYPPVRFTHGMDGLLGGLLGGCWDPHGIQWNPAVETAERLGIQGGAPLPRSFRHLLGDTPREPSEIPWEIMGNHGDLFGFGNVMGFRMGF